MRNTVSGNSSSYPNFDRFMSYSEAYGINDAGVIVGSFTGGYHSGTAEEGYMFDTVTGMLSTLVDPSTGSNNDYYNPDPATLGYTAAFDINNAGQIVGRYTDAAGVEQSFVATPSTPTVNVPEPASVALLAFGTGIIALSRRRG